MLSLNLVAYPARARLLLIALLLACRQTPPAIPGDYGDPCSSSDDCGVGLACYGGACYSEGNDGPGDYGYDSYGDCGPDGCYYYDTSDYDSSTGYECNSDDDCADGYICEYYACIPAPGPEPVELPPCEPQIPELVEVTLAHPPAALGLADLDGDDDLDLYAALPKAGGLQLAFNDGLGGFTPAEPLVLGPAQSSMRASAGDLDDDLDLDFVVTRPDANELLLVFSQDGMFVPGPALAAAAPPQAVFASDLDGDTDVDLVAFSGEPSVVSVWVADGVGGFAPETELIAFPDAHASYFGRIDFDGPSDLLALPPPTATGALKFYTGTTQASVLFDQELALEGTGWTQALAGALDGPTSPDLVALRAVEGGNRGLAQVWLGTDDREWTDPPRSYVTTAPLQGGLLADGDGDGFVDIISATDSASLVILAGDSGGFTCEHLEPLPAPTAPDLMASGELDDDPSRELVVGLRGSTTVLVFDR